ncbi:hypothetical protein [Lacinutrix jangbogonensis]|uniref:hypothetical protein n=1 Tax=Lacinutrix jangbogonensis TaxID=1469557 RepID=UPI00053D783D|nr:hypothetical protein [Lacinutrix jangbogonensis]
MILNYLESKTYSISCSDVEVTFDYTSKKQKDYEVILRATPTHGLKVIDTLITTLSKKLTTATGELDVVAAVLKYAKNGLDTFIVFDDKGITIAKTFTIGFKDLVFTFIKKGDDFTFQFEMEAANFNLNLEQLKDLGVNLDISVKGLLKMSFTVRHTEISGSKKADIQPHIQFVLSKRSPQLPELKIPLPSNEHITFVCTIYNFVFEKDKTKSYGIRLFGSLKVKEDVPDFLSFIKDHEAKFFLGANTKGLQLGIIDLLKDKEVNLGSLKSLKEKNIDLGKLIIDIKNTKITLGALKGIETDIYLSLPEGLNKYLDSLGVPELLLTRKGTEDKTGTEKFGIKINASTAGISGMLIGNPFNLNLVKNSVVNITNSKVKNKDCWDIKFGKKGDYGEIKISNFTFSKGTGTSGFSISGLFNITKDLAIPLGFLKTILQEIELGNLSELVPEKVPIKGFKLLEPKREGKDREFNFTEVNKITTELFEKKEVKSIINTLGLDPIKDDVLSGEDSIKKTLNGFLNNFPTEFQEYLQVKIPKDIKIDLSVSPTGSITGGIDLLREDVKMLFLAGPSIYGITLRSFEIGQISAITSASVDIDATVHMFNLIDIFGTKAINASGLISAPKSTELLTTIELKKLFLVIPEEFPIPVPVFYDHIRFSYSNILGLKLESNFRFPKPKIDFVDLFSKTMNFTEYLTDNTTLIDITPIDVTPIDETGKPTTNKNDLKLSVGSNYIQLPEYLGGKKLGVEYKTVAKEKSISAWKPIAKGLNFIKQTSVNDLVAMIPIEYRIGSESYSFLDFFKIEGQWLLLSVKEINEAKNNGDPKLIPSNFPAKINDLSGLVALPNTKDGALLFLQGKFEIGSLLSMGALFGLVATNNGFITKFKFDGALAKILTYKLEGEVGVIQTKGKTNFNVSGSADVSFLGKTILGGSISLNNDMLHIHGEFFGGSLDLLIDQSNLEQKIAKVKWLILEYEIITGTIIISNEKLSLKGRFLGAHLGLELLSNSTLSGGASFKYDMSINLFIELEIDINLKVSFSIINEKISLNLEASFLINGVGLSAEIRLTGKIPTTLVKLKKEIEHKIRDEVTKEFDGLKKEFEEFEKAVEETFEETEKVITKTYSNTKKEIEKDATAAISIAEHTYKFATKGVENIIAFCDNAIELCEKAIADCESEIESLGKNLFSWFEEHIEWVEHLIGVQKTKIAHEKASKTRHEKIKNSKKIRKDSIIEIRNKQKTLAKNIEKSTKEALEKRVCKERVRNENTRQKKLDLLLEGIHNNFFISKIDNQNKICSLTNPSSRQRNNALILKEYYPKLVSFSIGAKNYISGQSEDSNYFFIQRIFANGVLGEKTAEVKDWKEKNYHLLAATPNNNTDSPVYIYFLSKNDNEVKKFSITSDGTIYPYIESVSKERFSELDILYNPYSESDLLIGYHLDEKSPYILIIDDSEKPDHSSEKRKKRLEAGIHTVTALNIEEKQYVLVQSKKDLNVKVWEVLNNSDNFFSKEPVLEVEWGNYYSNLISFNNEDKTYITGQSDNGWYITHRVFNNNLGELKFETIINSYDWYLKMDNLFPIHIDDDTYIAGQASQLFKGYKDINIKNFFSNSNEVFNTFLSYEIKEDGNVDLSLDNTIAQIAEQQYDVSAVIKLNNHYSKLVSVSIGETTFIAGQSLDGKELFIQKITVNGQLGKRTFQDKNWDLDKVLLAFKPKHLKNTLSTLYKYDILYFSSKKDNTVCYKVIIDGKLHGDFHILYHYSYSQLKFIHDLEFSEFRSIGLRKNENYQGIILTHYFGVEDMMSLNKEGSHSLAVFNIKEKFYVLVQSKIDLKVRIWTILGDSFSKKTLYKETWDYYYPNLFSYTKNGKTYIGGQSENKHVFFISEFFIKNIKIVTKSIQQIKNPPFGIGNLLPIVVGDKVFIAGQVNGIGTSNIDSVKDLKQRVKRIKKDVHLKIINRNRRLLLNGLQNTFLFSKITSQGKLGTNSPFQTLTDYQKQYDVSILEHYYPQLVSFSIQNKSYITGQSESGDYFFIQKINKDGSLGEITFEDHDWRDQASSIFVDQIDESIVLLHCLSKKDNTITLRAVTEDGKLGVYSLADIKLNDFYTHLAGASDHLFNNHSDGYLIGLKEGGSAIFIYCFSKESKTVKQLINYELSSLVVLKIKDKDLVLGQLKDSTETKIWEFLSDGTLSEKPIYNRNWKNHYQRIFSFNKEGKTYMSGQSDTGIYFIDQVFINEEGKLKFKKVDYISDFSYEIGNLFPIQVGDDTFIAGQVKKP